MKRVVVIAGGLVVLGIGVMVREAARIGRSIEEGSR